MPRNRYSGDRDHDHARPGAAPIGILVSNLGTPEAPTAAALRPYLREFLSDPRVIELPRVLWWLILELFVLPFRPRKSAELYAKVWTPAGSPLLRLTEKLARELGNTLEQRVEAPLEVAVAMRYGEPSIRHALRGLRAAGCRRVLSLPLYPHYSGTTGASTFDAVVDELKGWRWIPELRTVNGWHDDPSYVRALADSIREVWAEDGGPAEMLLFSFHGIPLRYFLDGDPYYCLCQKTARLVAEELELPGDRWQVTFQSLFGKEEWLKPYTDQTVRRLGAAGLSSLDVVCPGFAVDCLETLEEIDGLNREIFDHAGGGRFRYIPALNVRPDHVALLAGVASRHLAGWSELVRRQGTEDAAARARRAEEQRRDLDAMTETAIR